MQHCSDTCSKEAIRDLSQVYGERFFVPDRLMMTSFYRAAALPMINDGSALGSGPSECAVHPPSGVTQESKICYLLSYK